MAPFRNDTAEASSVNMRWALAILFIIGPAASAGAQSLKPGAVALGGQLGWAIPEDDLGDVTNSGPFLGVHGRYGILENVSAVGELEYYWLGSKDFSASAVSATSKARVFTIDALGRYDLALTAASYVPFVEAGLSLNVLHTDVVVSGAETTDTSTHVGLIIGAGADHDINDQWTLGGDVRFRTFSSKASAVTFAVRLSFKTTP